MKYSSDPVLDLLDHLTRQMPAHAAQLSELDARLGDGDLGSTIELGCTSMSQTLDSLRGKTPGQQLLHAGMAFNRGGASTFGALIATALMQAGKTAGNKPRLEASDFPSLGRAAIEAMMKRGKANFGDKTLLDALSPAVEAFDAALSRGCGATDAMKQAIDAAQHAVEETSALQSKVSRAGWLAERSIGQRDPGAVAVVHVLQCALAWMSQP